MLPALVTHFCFHHWSFLPKYKTECSTQSSPEKSSPQGISRSIRTLINSWVRQECAVPDRQDAFSKMTWICIDHKALHSPQHPVTQEIHYWGHESPDINLLRPTMKACLGFSFVLADVISYRRKSLNLLIS